MPAVSKAILKMFMLKRKHEQSVIDAFFHHLVRAANRQGKKFVYCSLDGQDRLVGADYLLTETTKFIIAEFKYDENDIASERNKPLRHTMCTRLENEPNRQDEHENSHFIAWSSGLLMKIIHLNQYSNEVCNREVLGFECGLNSAAPIIQKRITADEFIGQCLSGEIGLPFESFHSYVTWLMENPDDGSGDGPQAFIELLLQDESRDDLTLIGFSSLVELKNWLDNNYPETTNTYFAQ